HVLARTAGRGARPRAHHRARGERAAVLPGRDLRHAGAGRTGRGWRCELGERGELQLDALVLLHVDVSPRGGWHQPDAARPLHAALRVRLLPLLEGARARPPLYRVDAAARDVGERSALLR